MIVWINCVYVCLFFFFFKQKTAYEMRISDWSSDVCSSDLVKHIQQLGDWAKEGKFIYAGRRNEGGARFRSGECALFTESSAGYAGVKAEAAFDFGVSTLPYWDDVEGAPQTTIIGGASLWVLSGHPTEEYAGLAKFFSHPSRPALQAQRHPQDGQPP